MNQTATIHKMNELARKGKKFLFVIDYKTENSFVAPLNELNQHNILFDVEGHKNYSDSRLYPEEFYFKKKPVNFERYQQAFELAKKNIVDGNTYLLNLTFPTRIETDLSLRDIFHISQARYKLFFKNRFVVLSPEIFVKINGNKISSYPMKGTIDAGIERARSKILSDKKELAEHATIVDLIRNDLSRVARNVQVEKYRYLEKINTNGKDLLQVSSKISGQLPHDWQNNIGQLLFSLLPAGSITGAPKKKTMEIIAACENYNRGFYTGIFGVFDGKNLNSAVMIRFFEHKDGELWYKSGGGITSKSNLHDEYNELIDKVYVPLNRKYKS